MRMQWTLRRYFLLELLRPLGVSLSFLFALLLVMQLLRGSEVLLGSAASLLDFGRLLVSLAPHFLVMALPISFLLGLLLGLGRMGEDNELTALQAMGLSPRRLLTTPVALGVGVSVAMLGLAAGPEPRGLSAVKRVVNEIIKRNVVGDVKAGVFYEDLPNLTIYAEEVEPQKGRWTHVLLQDDRPGVAPLLVVAESGFVDAQTPGEALTLGLREGQVHRADATAAQTGGYSVIDFGKGEISVGVEQSIWRKNRFRSPKEELTPVELWQAGREQQLQGGDPRPFWAQFHVRLGQALSPIAFALLGVPLALSRRGMARGRGYVVAIVGYVAYYVLYRAMENLGAQGVVPLAIAGQFPNLLFAGTGVLWLWRMGRPGAVR